MAAVACLDPKHTDDMAEMDALIRLWCLRVLHDLQFHTHVSLSDVTRVIPR